MPYGREAIGAQIRVSRLLTQIWSKQHDVRGVMRGEDQTSPERSNVMPNRADKADKGKPFALTT